MTNFVDSFVNRTPPGLALQLSVGLGTRSSTMPAWESNGTGAANRHD